MLLWGSLDAWRFIILRTHENRKIETYTLSITSLGTQATVAHKDDEDEDDDEEDDTDDEVSIMFCLIMGVRKLNNTMKYNEGFSYGNKTMVIWIPPIN